MRVWLVCLLAAASLAAADDFEPPYLREKGWRPLLPKQGWSGWLARGGGANQWFRTEKAALDPGNPERLSAAPSTSGAIVVNSASGKVNDIYTSEKFGDCEIYVEWMIPKKSNSGVYLQGLYEIQIFDSFGVVSPNESQAGGIYHQWINDKPVGGSSPARNASRAPGEWQYFHAWFQAPRFDASGRKTAQARFLKVIYNGQVVQENVEVAGPTRAHLDIPEAAANPLMLQGDHGPVAYRNLYIKPLEARR